jgi:hypothetical protein
MNRHHERNLSTVVRWIGDELDRGRSVDEVVRVLEEQGMSPNDARYLVEQVAVQPGPVPALRKLGWLEEGSWLWHPTPIANAVGDSTDGDRAVVFEQSPGITWH